MIIVLTHPAAHGSLNAMQIYMSHAIACLVLSELAVQVAAGLIMEKHSTLVANTHLGCLPWLQQICPITTTCIMYRESKSIP